MGKPKKKAPYQQREKKYKRRHDAFTIYIVLEATEEKFTFEDACNDMTIAQLKGELELVTGIPVAIQRLSYLDDGELQEHTDIRSNDFVPGSTVQLKVWPMYKELIEAVVGNEIDWVFRLGVTNPSDYHTPASDYMTKKSRKAWLEDRSFIALCLASHRGHEEMVNKLIGKGADVNRKTQTGKTPLHLASARGHGEIVNALLHQGADINAVDENETTALSVAERFGSKVCSRYLFQFQWQERAKDIKPSKKVPLFAHQYHDSNLPVWKRGAGAQIYVAKILKPGEFEGTSLSAPRGGYHPSLIRKQIRDATFFRDSPDSNASEMNDYFPDETGAVILPPIKNRKKTNLKKPLSYEEWLSNQTEIERKANMENKKQTEEDTRKKLEEEEKKKEENEKLVYEKWLAQRELDKLEKSTRHSSPVKNPSTIPDINSLIPVHHDGALRQYLRGLGKSKTGVNYEDWLNEKEMEINTMVHHMKISAPV